MIMADNSIFIQVPLLTRTGELVTTVGIPNFTPPAEVIQWGSRIFVYNNASQGYYEGLLYYVPEEAPEEAFDEDSLDARD